MPCPILTQRSILIPLLPVNRSSGLFQITISFLLVLIATFTISEAHCKPVIEIKNHHYIIQGKTADEIRRSLNKNSTVVVRNKRYDAYTHWYVSWNIWYSNSNNRCAISKITTRTQISHTMPKLISTVPSHLLRKWQKYYYALLDHERGHGNISLEAAHEIERNISNLLPQPNCTMLEKKANKLGQEVIRKYVAQEKTYDKETRHGAITGAVFP